MITVLGANGYIGKRIVRSLEKYTDRPIIKVDPSFGGVYDGYRSPPSLGNYGTIINASGPGASPGCSLEEYTEAKELCRSFRAQLNCDRFIHISSIAAAKGAESPYSWTKLGMENIVKSRPNFAILRIHNVAGEFDDKDTRLIPSLINSFYSRRSFELKVSGHSRLDFISVNDVGDAIAQAALTGIQGTYEIGSGTTYSIYDVIREVQKLNTLNNIIVNQTSDKIVPFVGYSHRLIGSPKDSLKQIIESYDKSNKDRFGTR